MKQKLHQFEDQPIHATVKLLRYYGAETLNSYQSLGYKHAKSRIKF